MTKLSQCPKSRRTFSKLLILALGLPKTLYAMGANPIPGIPIVRKWDIRPANSQIELDFRVTEHRNYYVYIDFNRGGPYDFNELRKFTGRGGAYIVTNEQNPVVVVVKTPEEMQQALKRIDSGAYKWQPDTGEKMPIHIKLEKLDEEATHTAMLILEDTFTTDRECFGLDRAITEVALRPGIYRIRLNTLQETYIAAGAESSLVIAYRPKTRTLKD